MISVLDTDLYKLTMQQAVLEHYPDTQVTYRFTNRGKHHFGINFVNRLAKVVNQLAEARLTPEEKAFLASLGFFKPQYLEYLSNYRFDPKQLTCVVDNDNSLQIIITGPWHSTILWEVPLMAMISELYFEDLEVDEIDVYNKAAAKARALANVDGASGKCKFAEFGTRRRRSSKVQETVLRGLIDGSAGYVPRHLVGTSNVFLAMKHGLKPIGTMAHEWIMGVSALESLRYANRFALQRWKDTYKADLGIALTDTFGTEAFFRDFDLELAKVYDGVRHDSGDPLKFAQSVINKYTELGINPLHKTIIFSDGLNVDKCLNINNAYGRHINVAFGIGTHFTNDFEDAKALNMVIKLRTVNGIPVVKLSDEPGKETGDEKAVEVAKWTFS